MSDDAKKTSPFVLRMPAAFWWTVRVPVPADDDYTVATLELQFKPVPQARLDQFRGIGLEDGQALPPETEICRRVVCGWRNLTDAAGAAVEFSPEALEHLLAVPVVRASIVATYMAVMSGMGARKNG